MLARAYNGLVSIIPPNAKLSSYSRIGSNQLGKVPGIPGPSGWKGYDWLRHTATDTDAEQWDRAGANIGIRSADTPAVDIDVTDVRLAELIERTALDMLGPAPIRSRTNSAKRLLMYRTAEPFDRLRLWITPTGASPRQHLVEVLGRKHQYAIYGTHPSGAPYQWTCSPDTHGPDALTAITCEAAIAFLDELERRLAVDGVTKLEREGRGRTTTASAVDQADLLAPSMDALRDAVSHLPNSSALFPARDDYLTVGYAIRAAAGAANEHEGYELFVDWASRWDGGVNDSVEGDWDRMNASEKRVGYSWLAEHARPHGFSDAVYEFEIDPSAEPPDLTPAYVVRLNQTYAKVRAVANAVLYTPKQGAVEYIPQRHWLDMLANDVIEQIGPQDKIKSVPVARLWMQHPKRRTYDRVVFDPTKPSLCGVPSPTTGLEDFNLWPGLALVPSPDGSCERFLTHVREIVCCNDDAAYTWVLMWLAALVQHPERLAGTALALRGEQGTGKTIVGKVMGKILGPSLYTLVSGTEELTGRFNSHREGRVLIQVEEAFFAGDPRIVGQLKHMITSDVVRVERKHIDSFTIDNFARILVTSNSDWVVPAGEGERRFMVLTVSPSKKGNDAYFRELVREMLDDERGAARLLHYLLNDVTIDWDQIRRPIGTDALRDQQIQSLEPAKQWLYEVLNEGTLPGDADGNGCPFADELRGSYEAYMKKRDAGRRASAEKLGKMLREFGVEKAERRDAGQKRKYYVFLPLAETRQRFAAALATTPEWDAVDEWQSVVSNVFSQT